MKKSIRAHAAEVIDALQNQQSNLDALLRKHSVHLNPNDKKLLQSICYGICREWFHLEAIESQLLDKPLKARDQILSAIVRCGIFELGWMGSKEHAVVSRICGCHSHRGTTLGARPCECCLTTIHPQKIRTQNGASLRTDTLESPAMAD